MDKNVAIIDHIIEHIKKLINTQNRFRKRNCNSYLIFVVYSKA